MYAIIKDRGKQYKVEPGQSILIDFVADRNDADQIEFSDVVALGDGDKGKIGTPFVSGVKVVGEIEGHKKGNKIDVYKFKRRKDYRRKQGHRQRYTQVKIKEIVV
ncbi:MAG: 50S ribosomal protein L21 [Candidatus Brocadiales bacterium]